MQTVRPDQVHRVSSLSVPDVDHPIRCLSLHCNLTQFPNGEAQIPRRLSDMHDEVENIHFPVLFSYCFC